MVPRNPALTDLGKGVLNVSEPSRRRKTTNNPKSYIMLRNCIICLEYLDLLNNSFDYLTKGSSFIIRPDFQLTQFHWKRGGVADEHVG